MKALTANAQDCPDDDQLCEDGPTPGWITRELLEWGRDNYRKYPWREVDDPWLGLLAEVLLQRTNAAHVARVWPKLSARFPAPETVLEASDSDLKLVDYSLGLNRRARTLRELAEYIDTLDYYPCEYEELVSIYGIGHYTAAAYLSLHLKTRAVLMDSNIARWLSRLTGLEKPKDLRRRAELWELAERLTPRTGFQDYNYAVLDFTMLICKPRAPECAGCFFSGFCDYSRHIG